MIKEFTRPLKEDEKNWIEKEKNQLEKRNSFQKKLIVVAIVLVIMLCIAFVFYLWDNLESFILYALIAFVLYIAIMVFSYWKTIKNNKKIIENISEALTKNEVKVIHLSIGKMVKVEEAFFEGDGLFFQISKDEMIYFEGRIFEETEKFPNTDFEFIRVYGKEEEDDFLVLQDIYTHGIKLKPEFIISKKQKRKILKDGFLPESTQKIEGELNALESLLMTQN